MGEKQKLIVKYLTYEGLFNYKEFFRIMDFWFRDKFYDKMEKRSEEFITPKGKVLDFEFTPWKKVTDYYKIVIKVELACEELKEVEVEREGKKVRMHHGKMDVKFTGYLIVDYDSRWDRTPMLYFIRDFFDRYIYWYVYKKYYKMVIDHTTDLYNTLATYLNVAEYKKE